MTAPIIQLEGVNKWFGTFHALTDVDLAISEGDVVIVCGPSGSGKSTLIRCINGLESVQSGRIVVMGRTLTESSVRSVAFRTAIGMVFQRFSLYPHMKVVDNVTLALRKVRGFSRSEADHRARTMLERVGLLSKANSFPNELSGGQQQRVAIARALVLEPRIMLFDEPTSALDPEMIREVLDVMRDLARSGITMLIVTHEMGFARQVADQVIFMDGGRVVEAAKMDAFFSNPGTPRARQFIDHIIHH
jgi:ABC-type polar amino acid transport system ATPase subunit